MKTIAAATAIHFRGELRRARERALSDGEGYQPILFTTNPGRYGCRRHRQHRVGRVPDAALARSSNAE